MKKTLCAAALLLTTTSSFAENFGNTGSYQAKNWQDVYNQTVEQVAADRKLQEQNYLFNLNKRIDSIEAQKRTSFDITAPRVVDIYVRESYTVLENDYVVKNAPIWKKVMIKQKEVWDY